MTIAHKPGMRIAIIGAGCSGLTAIKHVLEAGLQDIVCYEQSGQIGGNWVYNATPGYSGISRMTHTISSKALSQFSDFPMPADYPDYPSHQQILAYFQAYASHFQLEKFIRFNIAVRRVEKIDGERWRLFLSDGSQSEADYLLVANGHLTVPRHPEWRENFTGRYLHTHDFKTNEGLRNQRVLVVGAGNSGCDCAVEASHAASQVDISLRTPQYIIPKIVMGKPVDTFAASLQWLPQSVQSLLQKLSLRLQIGRYRGYGLPEPGFSPTQARRSIRQFSTRSVTAKYGPGPVSGAFPVTRSILPMALRNNTMSSWPRPAIKSVSRSLIRISSIGKSPRKFRCTYASSILLTPACFLPD